MSDEQTFLVRIVGTKTVETSHLVSRVQKLRSKHLNRFRETIDITTELVAVLECGHICPMREASDKEVVRCVTCAAEATTRQGDFEHGL